MGFAASTLRLCHSAAARLAVWLFLCLFAQSTVAGINLKVGTFNVKNGFNGTVVDNKYQADPAAVSAIITKLNELDLDLLGLQEGHDLTALQSVAAGTSLGLAEARTHVYWIYPPAVLSKYSITSFATYNTSGGQRLMTEAEVQLPDGTTIYVFSMHLEWAASKRVHTRVSADLVLRRAGSHPVLLFGDMNGNSGYLGDYLRHSLHQIYADTIDDIWGTPHFQIIGSGTNHGNLGFSDHPLLTVEVAYTPDSAVHSAIPSLYHDMAPGESWNAGAAAVPDTSLLTSITINPLPVRGLLELDGVAVTLDQVIPAAAIHQLTYTAPAGSLGKDYFGFSITEPTPPPVSPQRFVDIAILKGLSDIRFAEYDYVFPPTTEGHGFWDLGYAQPGELIYCPIPDDGKAVNFDVFSDQLPVEMRGLIYIQNGGRNESDWPVYKDGPYKDVELTDHSRVFLALGRRGDGSARTMPGWTQRWANRQINAANALGYDIFDTCHEPGWLTVPGNQTVYPYHPVEENLVVFIDPDDAACQPPTDAVTVVAEPNFLLTALGDPHPVSQATVLAEQNVTNLACGFVDSAGKLPATPASLYLNGPDFPSSLAAGEQASAEIACDTSTPIDETYQYRYGCSSDQGNFDMGVACRVQAAEITPWWTPLNGVQGNPAPAVQLEILAKNVALTSFHCSMDAPYGMAHVQVDNLPVNLSQGEAGYVTVACNTGSAGFEEAVYDCSTDQGNSNAMIRCAIRERYPVEPWPELARIAGGATPGEPQPTVEVTFTADGVPVDNIQNCGFYHQTDATEPATPARLSLLSGTVPGSLGATDTVDLTFACDNSSHGEEALFYACNSDQGSFAVPIECSISPPANPIITPPPGMTGEEGGPNPTAVATLTATGDFTSDLCAFVETGTLNFVTPTRIAMEPPGMPAAMSNGEILDLTFSCSTETLGVETVDWGCNSSAGLWRMTVSCTIEEASCLGGTCGFMRGWRLAIPGLSSP